MLKQIAIACLLLSALSRCAQPPAVQSTPPPPTIQLASPPPTSQPTLVPQPTQPPAAQARGEMIHEKITSQALAGNLVGDPVERGYYIYLPPGYADGTKRFPVVYILHTFTGSEYQFLFLESVYHKMLQQDSAQEMILVLPNANNKFGGSMYRSSPTIGDYETYIARELVAHIDANYRTIPQRDSRGITGCSMGGDGAMHLALTFPDVYSVVASMSAGYDWTPDSTVKDAAATSLTRLPQDFDELRRYSLVSIGVYIAIAAGAAPNPDKPPFYLDMPFEVVDGKGRIVPEVMQKIVALDEVRDLEDYLQQTVPLRHILLYHSTADNMVPVEMAHSFDHLLTARGVEHEYVEVAGGHCDYDMTPVLQFMSDHLVGEQP